MNKIGSGSSSSVQTAKTDGNKPISPRKQYIVRPNITSVVLELTSWQDGGCSILYFTIEYKSYSRSDDWIVVSSNVLPQARFTIGDLEPQSRYTLRITAVNNVGPTIVEYLFETLSLQGGMDLWQHFMDNFFKKKNLILVAVSTEADELEKSEMSSYMTNFHVLIFTIISTFFIILVITGACFCIRARKFFF